MKILSKSQMGETTTILFILITITHVSLLINSVIAVNPGGFTMRMIHKDSKESPFSLVDDHLTEVERFESLFHQSKRRARYIRSQILLHTENATSSMKPDVVRVPVVYEEGSLYVGLVGIGTFPDRPQPFLNYYLMIDSGSYLTWLQCKGATQTFNQDWAEWPLYPWEDSTTYQPIPCTYHDNINPACNSCNDRGECIYREVYASTAVTSGVIAKETFTINSDTGGGLESLQLFMGCGFRQENFNDYIGNNHRYGKPDLIAGILGLGRAPLSFLNQLGPVGQGKFAYCLERTNKDIHAGNTYLSFGADAKIGGEGQQVHSTPIVEHATSYYYYLILEDISVGDNNVGFAREDFEIKANGGGGCVIDSGTQITTMYKDHFDRVALLVVAYFEQFGMRRDESTGTILCFVKRPGVQFTIPKITFHFQQANYVVAETGFAQIDGNVCLAIGRLDRDTPAFILGARQQVDKRILYDNINLELSFAEEKCQIGF